MFVPSARRAAQRRIASALRRNGARKQANPSAPLPDARSSFSLGDFVRHLSLQKAQPAAETATCVVSSSNDPRMRTYPSIRHNHSAANVATAATPSAAKETKISADGDVANAAASSGKKLNILFLTNAHNSMSQRAYVELTRMGHDVTVELALSEEQMVEVTKRVHPDLIVGPFLTKRVSPEIWKNYTTLIIHPGIHGDRGCASLDWALQDAVDEWGVTVLEASDEMDAGDVWSTNNFPLKREGILNASITKSSLYKNEVITAGMKGLKEAIFKFQNGIKPIPLNYKDPNVKGTLRPTMKQKDRAIDWNSSAEEVVRRLAASDGQPGVLDNICGEEVFLFGGHMEEDLNKKGKYQPKQLIAVRENAVCIATGHNGAVWVTHMKKKNTPKKKFFKLPSSMVLPQKDLAKLPQLKALSPLAEVKHKTYREIWARIENGVCHLHFDFYNGAMSTEQCIKLQSTIEDIKKRKDLSVLVLYGGYNYFSNGVHLNTIEAAEDPSLESWKNINAINDVVKSIMDTPNLLVVAALQGNAGAGGMMLALGADKVYTHHGVVLNPHYRSMGLYGSEYWTYNLPRRVGAEKAEELTENCHPVGAKEAFEMGLVDEVLGRDAEEFRKNMSIYAQALAQRADLDALLSEKKAKITDAWRQDIQRHRDRELMIMKENFRDSIYHDSRRKFVYKETPTDTPQHLVKAKGLGKLMDGKLLSQHIRHEITQEVENLQKKYDARPGLALIIAGSNPASEVYVKMKEKWADQVGFKSVVSRFDDKDPNLGEKIRMAIDSYNRDSTIDGILVQLPLPASVANSAKILATIRPEKDVDAFSSLHIGQVATNYHDKSAYFLPCTARAIMELLTRYDIKVAGKKVCIVGASNIVGLPIALCLLRQCATIEVCHVHTLHLEKSVRNADIIVAATGQAHLIKGEWIKTGAVVIDAGISVIRDGPETAITGDVQFEEAKKRAAYITPVPGGVGPMTVTMLLRNTLDSFQMKLAREQRALSHAFLENKDVELFLDHFDKNHDQQLDREELVEVVANVLRSASAASASRMQPLSEREIELKSQEVVNHLLRLFDQDSSGTLDKNEITGVNILQEVYNALGLGNIQASSALANVDQSKRNVAVALNGSGSRHTKVNSA